MTLKLVYIKLLQSVGTLQRYERAAKLWQRPGAPLQLSVGFGATPMGAGGSARMSLGDGNYDLPPFPSPAPFRRRRLQGLTVSTFSLIRLPFKSL